MAKAKKAKAVDDIKVVKGSHLTVTAYPDGRTELQWDWDALVKDVDMAIKSVGTAKPEAKMPKKKASIKKPKM